MHIRWYRSAAPDRGIEDCWSPRSRARRPGPYSPWSSTAAARVNRSQPRRGAPSASGSGWSPSRAWAQRCQLHAGQGDLVARRPGKLSQASSEKRCLPASRWRYYVVMVKGGGGQIETAVTAGSRSRAASEGAIAGRGNPTASRSVGGAIRRAGDRGRRRQRTSSLGRRPSPVRAHRCATPRRRSRRPPTRCHRSPSFRLLPRAQTVAAR